MTKAEDLDLLLSGLASGFRRLKGIGDVSDCLTEDISFQEWDWEIGVGLYGDFRRAEADGDGRALERIARWYDRQIARGLPRRQINATAPMLTLALLAQRTGREDWRTTVQDWAHWIWADMPKTEEGGYQHLVKERDNEGQLWDDTLFMAVLFMAVAGKLCNRRDWVEDAHYQFLTHIRFLGDPVSGLFFHGWTFVDRHRYARALWARGNAWITIAIPELFRIVPPAGALGRYLMEVYASQVAALAKLQNADGMFHTLLNEPESPVEASGTAGIGYGVLAGIREGLICSSYRSIAENALAAIIARIGEDGLLEDVSDGTAMGTDLEFYRRIPNRPTPYGQALASLFLAEGRRYLTPESASRNSMIRRSTV